jgi:hypothetical protein
MKAVVVASNSGQSMPSGLALQQGLVEHQESPGVPVEGLERVDARVNRHDLGREHHPRQAELLPGRDDRKRRGEYGKHTLDRLQPGEHGRSA